MGTNRLSRKIQRTPKFAEAAVAVLVWVCATACSSQNQPNTAALASTVPAAASANQLPASASPSAAISKPAVAAPSPSSPVSAGRWNFDSDPVGSLPSGAQIFSGQWAVRAEADAPSPPNALCQTGQADYPAIGLDTRA